MPSITELQPYFAAVGALLSVATLALVVNLVRLMSEASRARAEVLEERLKRTQDDLQRTEKWNERKTKELTEEMTNYKNQLKVSLDDAGINLETLALGRSTQNLADEIRQTIEQTLSRMQETLEKIHQTSNTDEVDSPNWHLELAKGLMATGNWMKAAAHFERYVQYDSLNWEVQFSRAISYANSRGGYSTDLSALRAINETIALAIEERDLSIDLRARLFSYRAGVLKRLGRFDEAEADLNVASKYANREHEVLDIKYNWACLFALRQQRKELIETILSISEHRDHLLMYAAIRAHLPDYFAAFADDTEFLKLIKSR